MKKRQIIGEAAAKSEFDEPPTATISTTVRQRPDRNIKDYILKIGPSFFFLWIDYIANLFFCLVHAGAHWYTNLRRRRHLNNKKPSAPAALIFSSFKFFFLNLPVRVSSFKKIIH
jgi:hypothetical protein